jgi:hypothetical protein
MPVGTALEASAVTTAIAPDEYRRLARYRVSESNYGLDFVPAQGNRSPNARKGVKLFGGCETIRLALPRILVHYPIAFSRPDHPRHRTAPNGTEWHPKAPQGTERHRIALEGTSNVRCLVAAVLDYLHSSRSATQINWMLCTV